MSKKVAYLGPAGTFTEEAALLYEEKGHLIPFSSISAVAAAVETGIAEEGVAAIENSIEGSVTETLDLLIHESKLLIRHELVLPIEHHLLVKPGTQSDEIKIIFSYPITLSFMTTCVFRN